MDLLKAIDERHSVRSYTDREIEKEKIDAIQKLIDECNEQGDLHIQFVKNEPRAFDSFMAHYGTFSGVKNYIALIGKRCKNLDEKLGYYGEKIALFAQESGLNTSWVAMSYKKIKTAFSVEKGEKLVLVIAIGYGVNQGKPHKSKPVESVCDPTDKPEWFINGILAALKAPTAINQQKFYFDLTENKVCAKSGTGFYTKVDLGIAKCHFAIGAGQNNFSWENDPRR